MPASEESQKMMQEVYDYLGIGPIDMFTSSEDVLTKAIFALAHRIKYTEEHIA